MIVVGFATIAFAVEVIAEGKSAPRARKRDDSAASEIIAARPRQVGYRRIDFAFETASGDKRTRQLDLWYPTTEKEQRFEYKGLFGTRGPVGFAAKEAAVAAGPHPLLVFSHGFLGSSDQSIFLTEACARAGYVVASMNHADGLGTRLREQRRQEPPKFAEFATWTDAKYRDRREDIVALLDRLLEWSEDDDSPWHGRIDVARVGGMGHSLGGYTVLGVAGGWESWREPRIKAAVLFSPFAQPFDVNGKLEDVSIPVMIQGGTLDLGITPFLPPVYKKLDGPKSLLVLKNETHFGWTNLISLGKTTTECVAGGNAKLMVDYTIAFFDQHLLDVDRSDVLEAPNDRLQSYVFEAE
jgi:predicted dienelactone hydrolase